MDVSEKTSVWTVYDVTFKLISDNFYHLQLIALIAMKIVKFKDVPSRTSFQKMFISSFDVTV